jgi:hypothetical protein
MRPALRVHIVRRTGSSRLRCCRRRRMWRTCSAPARGDAKTALCNAAESCDALFHGVLTWMAEAHAPSSFLHPLRSLLRSSVSVPLLRFSNPIDMAAPAALHLQALPHEVLLRIVSAGAFDTPEQLLAAGSVCHALRAAVGCPSVVSLRPLWARTIIAVADPTASLAAPPNLGLGLEHAYTEHAAAFARGRSCGWFALAHALAARNCAACGDVTRGVAWRLPAAARAAAGGIRLLQSCCAACTPVAHAPPADADDAGGAACVDATSGSDDDDEDGLGTRFCTTSLTSKALLRCMCGCWTESCGPCSACKDAYHASA